MLREAILAVLAASAALASQRPDADLLRPGSEGKPPDLVSGKLELGDYELEFRVADRQYFAMPIAEIRAFRFSASAALPSGQALHWADPFKHKDKYFLAVESLDPETGKTRVSVFRLGKSDLDWVELLSHPLCHAGCNYRRMTRMGSFPNVFTVSRLE